MKESISERLASIRATQAVIERNAHTIDTLISSLAEYRETIHEHREAIDALDADIQKLIRDTRM